MLVQNPCMASTLDIGNYGLMTSKHEGGASKSLGYKLRKQRVTVGSRMRGRRFLTALTNALLTADPQSTRSIIWSKSIGAKHACSFIILFVHNFGLEQPPQGSIPQ